MLSLCKPAPIKTITARERSVSWFAIRSVRNFFLHHWQQISFPVCNQLSKLEPGNPVPLKYNLCNIQTKERTRPHQQSCTLAVSSISTQLRLKKRQEGKGKYNLRHTELCALTSSRLCCKAKTHKRTHGLKLVETSK